MTEVRVIGMISGTSYDGIEVAAADLRLDGADLELTGLGALTVPLGAELTLAIEAVLPPAATTVEAICRLDTRCGQAFASAARRGVDELCDGRADLVVSHGQTVFHWVQGGRALGSLQLGQPAWIAEATGLPVVGDLRARDIAAGGQGAPLASMLDVLLLAGSDAPAAALNLGGIANATVVTAGADPIAFDTGPANALIDAAVVHLTDGRERFDRDGAAAARGHVVPELLARLLDEDYYGLPAPKSTGKELFHLPYLLAAMEGIGPYPDDDVVTTATELTARTVADALARFELAEVVAAGGGTRNPELMRRLGAALNGPRLTTTEAFGLPAQAKEAYAFAVLGFLAVHGLAGTVSTCTGARHASVLGSLTPGRRPLRVPREPPMAPERLIVRPA